MSWLFSQALVAEYSAATCSDGEPFAPLSVMPTPHKFSRNDKTMEPSDLSRFGLTCAVLTAGHGEALLTSFRAAFRVRTSAWPAEAQDSMASAPASGPKWPGSLAKYAPPTRSWRTAQRSLFGDSDECSVIWPKWGMTRDGECWALPMLGHRISETGFGFLQKLWPTPTATLGSKGGRVTPRKSREGGTLIEAVSSRSFPTPTARDWRSGKASEATMMRNSRPLSEQIGGSLNPTWVEWLMGWPLGWTDLKPSGTGKFPSVPQRRGEC
jgi:hypothetical protein